MADVTEQPAAPANGDGGWILDEDQTIDKRWILNEDEMPPQDADTPPAAETPALPPSTPGALPGQGFQYTTATGHTFRGATPDDVLKQMEGAVVRSATLAADMQRAQASLPMQTGADRGAAPRQEPQAAPFDPNEYYKLLADTKPLEAHEYLMRHYTGLENPRDAITFSYSNAQKMQDRMEVADFMTNNLDFPSSPQAAELLLRRIDAEHMPITRWNLEVAKTKLYSEGALQPLAAQAHAAAAPATTPAPAPASRGAQAPPAPRSGGMAGGGERELSDAELYTMLIEKHREYLRKKGIRV